MANSSSPTPTATPSTLDLIGYPIIYFLCGAGFTTSFFALMKVADRIIQEQLSQDPDRPQRKQPILNAILFLFNSLASLNMILVVLVVVSPFREETSCIVVNFAQNLTIHGYLILFDFFILFKSYIVMRKHPLYLALSILVYSNRLVWGIVDLKWSGGVWDNESATCTFVQFALSGVQVSLADIMVDSVGTLGAVVAFFSSGSHLLPFQSLSHQLLKENVLRTVVILTATSVLMYLNSAMSTLDVRIFFMFSLILDILTIVLMNLELYWKELRDEESTTSSMLGSAKHKP